MNARRWIARRLRREALYLKVVVPALLVVLLAEWLWWWIDVRDQAELHVPGVGLLFFVLGWYALVRAVRNVPYTHAGYRAWLAATPWTVAEPLPFGPAELDWPDAVILAAFLAVYATVPGHQSAKILAVFFFLHALALTPTIRSAANHVPAYITLFGLALMIKLWPQPWVCALTGVVVYLVVYDGLRLTLARFPRPGDEKSEAALAGFDAAKAACGWPYDRLLRDPGESAPDGDEGRALTPAEIAAIDLEKVTMRQGVRFADAMAWSLLLGWWVSCVGPVLFPGERYRAFLLAAFPVFAAVCGLIRIAIYTSGYRSPISPWGRLLTLRWIVPGYDVVFLGPLLTVAIPSTVFIIGLLKDLPLEIVGPTALAATLFIALAAPPSLRRWRLVGRHRIVPGVQADQGDDD